jgi:hypothetical protein
LGQPFVLAENLVFEVELDVARHHNERLAHGEGQDARNDRRPDDFQDADDELAFSDLGGDLAFLPVFDDFYRFSDELRRDQAKNLGGDRGQDAEQEMVFVLDEIFVEILKFFHRNSGKTIDVAHTFVKIAAPDRGRAAIEG